MKDRIGKSFGFLKTTALGGVLFLLPLAVVGAVLGYVYSLVSVVYKPLKEHIAVHSTIGIALLFCVAVLIIILLCFVGGLLARRAIGRKFSRTIEKQLVTIFPKYAIYKDLLADNIGGNENVPTLKSVLVRMDDSYRLAFEAERHGNGLVTVYLPGAPDTWNGTVALIPADRVESIDIPFSNLLGIFERLGRNSAHLLKSIRVTNG